MNVETFRQRVHNKTRSINLTKLEPIPESDMRLSSQSQHIIRDTVHEIFGPDANVLVFGSRVDDATRGGDLDLLVKTDEAVPDGRRKTLQLVAKLQMRLGDQPIDVLLLDAETDRQPVHEEAMRTGVRL